MRLALKIIPWVCGIAWCCIAFWFLALNYVAFWGFIGGSLIGLIPFMLLIGFKSYSPQAPEDNTVDYCTCSGFWPHAADCPERGSGSRRGPAE